MTELVDNGTSLRSCASKLFVCITCRLLDERIEDEQVRPGARLMKILSQRLEAGEQDIEIVPVECLSNCTRGCTVAVSGPGKWTYVIGALDPEQHADDVVRFARLHHTHAEGLPVWRERPVHIRKNTIARVPPLPRPAPTDLETAMTSLAKVPCTIVTGFLGAGKTTLVRHVLENAGGRRLAVIVNEFGDVGIDGEILKSCGIESCPEDRIVELSNGCICCTVADDFIPALKRLIDHPTPPEHIVIETSGLALPKPLVQAFNWPEIASRVTVDGVVAVVDGAAVAAGRFADDPEAVSRQRAQDTSLDHDNPLEEVYEDQLLCADLIVLNKADLMSAEERGRVVREVGGVVSRAVKIVEVENGRVSPKVLLGLGVAAELDVANRPSHHDSEVEHDHDDFESFVIDLKRFDTPQTLIAKIAEAAAKHDILRVKGFAEILDKPMRLLIQGVGSRIQHRFDRAWHKDEERLSRLVVIGQKGLDAAAIRNLIQG